LITLHQSNDEEGTIVSITFFDLIYLLITVTTSATYRFLEEKSCCVVFPAKMNFIRYSEHIAEDGEQFFEQIEKVHWKEIHQSVHQNGRAIGVKVKHSNDPKSLLGGYTQPRRSRTILVALVMGLYDGNK